MQLDVYICNIYKSLLDTTIFDLLLLFSCSVMSNSLQPHGLQHAWLHYFPECAQTHVHWVSDAIQPIHPLSSPSPPPQSFLASVFFQMSLLFTSGGQSIGLSASTSVLPMNTQDWSPLGWTGWISLQSKGLSRVFSTPQFKSINSFVLSPLYNPTLKGLRENIKKKKMEKLENIN